MNNIFCPNKSIQNPHDYFAHKTYLYMRSQVHAAIELLDLAALAKLLNEEARFHFGRKLTDSEVNIFAFSC